MAVIMGGQAYPTVKTETALAPSAITGHSLIFFGTMAANVIKSEQTYGSISFLP